MVSHDGECESCGATGVRTSRNRLPDGQTLELCYDNACIRKVRTWWREWANYIQPEQAQKLARQARRDERRRERQVREGVL